MKTGEEGIALVLAVMVSGLLAALGMSLLLVSDTERRVSANAGYSTEALAAADAGVERVMLDLAGAARWDDILGGSSRSGFADGTRRPTLPSGDVLDLDAETMELQSESSAQGTFGANTPQWRLFAWGPLATMAPLALASSQYVAVWVSDDPSEVDGNPSVDTNGVLTVHADARGPGGARRMVEATVARKTAGVMRMISWREVR
jgi:hypothetical protein